ncbi:MAG TPA: two-component system response regulator [Bacteroidales bacterium]|nr:two-component system response regulator [Bacteroidales bacterium]
MKVTILWVDDEIDFLKPHIIFLEEKGYTILTSNNGQDSLDIVKTSNLDLVFLDENMPGLSGLETLTRIKEIKPTLPVVMITKSEEENIMDQAIGSKITDYLIKPVSPKQVLLSIKKNVHNRQLITDKTSADYRAEFGNITQTINSAKTFSDWVEIHRKLVLWNIELADLNDQSLSQILEYQKNEANSEFAKFIKNNYIEWFGNNASEKPLMSPNLMRNKVFPLIDSGQKVLFILIDNFRYDQWKAIEPIISSHWRVESENIYCSILPTATQYARNAIFSGLMPLEIQKHYPDLWVFDEEDEGKNLNEEELLSKQIQRLGKNYKLHYEKSNTLKSGQKIVDNLKEVLKKDLTVLVFNFVDILSHARTEMEMMRELASDEAAYISITRSWFLHSDFWALIKEAAEQNVKLIITTDHGTVRVQNAVKVIGDKATSTNLRYKLGRNLNYNPKEVFEIRRPEDAHLPKQNVSSSFIFAYNNDFLAYPNNFNHYVKYYKNTFQHGGISLDEMLIPFIELKPIEG